LPARTETDPKKVEERQREKEVAKQRLADLSESSPVVRRAIDTVVEQLNGRSGEPESFDQLEKLLEGQAYRLCYWRVAADEINYRRFFDIDDLGAIRVERQEVFDAVHAVVLRLVGAHRVTGLRIDHPDGLVNPENYFLTLQAECRRAMAGGGELVLPKMPLKGLDCASYVVAEKILSHGEQLPDEWSVHGTTGYEMLNLINGIFVDSAAAKPLLQFYARLTERYPNFDDFVYEGKKLILDVSMSSELHVLARRLDRISEHDRWSRDFTFWSLHQALGEVIACFPVYRTYIRPDTIEPSPDDRRHVETAVRAAKRRNPAIDPSIYDFIASVLLLKNPDGISDEARTKRREFVLRVQQLTGSVTAKGFEDTAFYRAYPLASLNEVGGEPKRFSIPLDEFHERNQWRTQHWPFGMIGSTTHDTKRSEDVRARLNVLSEMPQVWIDTFERWRELNHPKKHEIDGREAPDPNEEYLLYQTLVGTWPYEPMEESDHSQYVDRICGYMEKALKEAKVHTSWINPNAEYDAAVARFVRTILLRNESNQFLDELQSFQQQIGYAGMCNSLSQMLVKATIPGVPDFYQGTELWTLTLVDPDNRRPVDYEKRMKWLDEIASREREATDQLLDDLLSNWKDGRIKLYSTYKTLNLRREHQQLFLEGSYTPVEVTGEHRNRVCAFVREYKNKAVLVVVPRWLSGLLGESKFPLDAAVWGDTALQLPTTLPQQWRNVLTSQTCQATSAKPKSAGEAADTVTIPVSQLLTRFPTALLTGS
jgi:(1->4)-alpha-D-glucan 1-alpha-D-glucosylmutase